MSMVFIKIDGKRIPAETGESLETYMGDEKVRKCYKGNLIIENSKGEEVYPAVLLSKDEEYFTRPPSHSEKWIENTITLAIVDSNIPRANYFSSILNNKFDFGVFECISISDFYEVAKEKSIDLVAIMFDELEKENFNLSSISTDIPFFIIVEDIDAQQKSEDCGYTTFLYEREFPENLRDFAETYFLKN